MNPSKEWKHISTKTARLTASVGRSKPGEAELKTSHAAAAGATSSVASARRSQAAEELHLTKAPTAFDITEDTIREARALDHGPNPADSLCMTTSKAFHGLSSMYPHLHHLATHAIQVETCPSQHANSKWAESLALHADKTWKPLLKTTYGTLNAEVNRGRWHMQGYPQ